MSSDKTLGKPAKALVFEARPRVSIDGFAFPEAYAYLSSIPPRQVNKVLEAIILRGLVSMLHGNEPSGTASMPSNAPRDFGKAIGSTTVPATPAPSTALATGDLSAFGSFDSKAFDYTTR